jgi:5-methylcytosine-specific restriction endonuclease McrA
MAFLKARRYVRQRGAEGSHTLTDWNSLKAKFNNRCAKCGESKPLTKDHIIPLSKGGSDYIENIQPLCRNCNSRKWTFTDIHENPELLEAK